MFVRSDFIRLEEPWTYRQISILAVDITDAGAKKWLFLHHSFRRFSQRVVRDPSGSVLLRTWSEFSKTWSETTLNNRERTVKLYPNIYFGSWILAGYVGRRVSKYSPSLREILQRLLAQRPSSGSFKAPAERDSHDLKNESFKVFVALLLSSLTSRKPASPGT